MQNWNDPLPPLLTRRRRTKLEKLANVCKIAWIKLQEMLPPLKGVCAILLVILALSLMGCAQTSTPFNAPRIPSPPPTRLSAEPPAYSQRAASDIQTWRQKLTAPTSRPAS